MRGGSMRGKFYTFHAGRQNAFSAFCFFETMLVGVHGGVHDEASKQYGSGVLCRCRIPAA